MALSAEELEAYARDGYVIPHNFRLSEKDLKLIERKHAALLESYPERFDNYCNALMFYDETF